jgi:ABC-2 type transport system permease protein
MFWHNYFYRLKCIIGDKQMMFWAFLFPILLATLFYMAFSNLSRSEKFSMIQIGIVMNAEAEKPPGFCQAIAGSKLFEITYLANQEAANRLLEDNKIEGYIYFDGGVKLAVKQSGIPQTILKSFLDDYLQTSATVTTIIRENPLSVKDGLLMNIANRVNYLKEVAIGKSAPDQLVNYFYTLIAMACLFGSFLGLKEVVAIQANLSPQGARVNIAPVHKLWLFMASVFAATTVQLVDILILLGYLALVLKINFGNQLGYIGLTCIIGAITGVTLGSCIAAISKKGEGFKIGILIGFINLASFLAGMNYDKIKYIINTQVPILGYLNPANLITDSLYSLYYYHTHTQFFTNIASLGAIAVALSIITYLVLRRRKYESL